MSDFPTSLVDILARRGLNLTVPPETQGLLSKKPHPIFDFVPSGAFVSNGMLGYRMPLNDGLLSSQTNGSKLGIDWHDELQKILLNANRNGDWNIQYNRKF
jgi:hypothetical protein